MAGEWEEVGYVVRSQYRMDVVERLGREGPATPTEIAEEYDHPQPHVSRALSELQEHRIVELLVPEEQHQGRFYGLTDHGEATWGVLEDRLDDPDWEEIDPSETPYGDCVEYLRRRVGDALRVVGTVREERVTTLYVREGIRDHLSDERRQLLFKHMVREYHTGRYADVEFWTGAPRYQMIAFEEVQNLMIPVGDGTDLLVSFEPDYDVRPAELVRECRERL